MGITPERGADQALLIITDVEVENRKSLNNLDFPEGDLDGCDMGRKTKIRRPVAIDGETKQRILQWEENFDEFNNFEHEWENANIATIDQGGNVVKWSKKLS